MPGWARRIAFPLKGRSSAGLDIPEKVGIGLGKGSERTAKRILELLVDGPMRPSALREAVGIKSPIHFSRYYLRPLMENGMIERTDPDSPKSPQTGVQAGMSYYINNTMSMGSAPFAPGPWMVAK